MSYPKFRVRLEWDFGLTANDLAISREVTASDARDTFTDAIAAEPTWLSRAVLAGLVRIYVDRIDHPDPPSEQPHEDLE